VLIFLQHFDVHCESPSSRRINKNVRRGQIYKYRNSKTKVVCMKHFTQVISTLPNKTEGVLHYLIGLADGTEVGSMDA
jgi:hypothetical protein